MSLFLEVEGLSGRNNVKADIGLIKLTGEKRCHSMQPAHYGVLKCKEKRKEKKNPAVLQLMVSETFVFVLCFRGCARQSPSTKYHRWKVSGSFRFAFLPYFIPSHLLSLVKLFKCIFCWGRRLTVKVPLSFLSLFFLFVLSSNTELFANKLWASRGHVFSILILLDLPPVVNVRCDH